MSVLEPSSDIREAARRRDAGPVMRACAAVYRRFCGAVLGNPRSRYYYLRLAKFLCTRGIPPLFSPSASSAKGRWRAQAEGTKTSPATYAKADASVAELFRDVLPHLGRESRILEIGSNAGRSLDYLYREGYRDLTGIEIGAEAVEMMKRVFPEAYRSSKVLVGDVAEVIKGLPSGGFDMVFCHSVLVNIPPRDNFVFSEMVRVARTFILTLESEGSCSAYPRDFRKIFEKRGFKMISCRIYKGACAGLPAPFEDAHIFENNTIRLFARDNTSFAGGWSI